MSRKALIIGIDKYKGDYALNSCVNDAKTVGSLINYNENKENNFNVCVLLDENATIEKINKGIDDIFDDDNEVGLFYFSGHSAIKRKHHYLATFDTTSNAPGIDFQDLLQAIIDSKCKNKIVILDSCFSGAMGETLYFDNNSVLPNGTTILSSSRSSEESITVDGHSIFTNLLINALKGEAADILGNITLGSIYSYIDKSLGAFGPRPVFKTNICEFISIRNVKKKMEVEELKTMHDCFDNPYDKFQLDPSFEPTNTENSSSIGKNDNKPPYFNEHNGKIFEVLQKAVSNGLVRPSNEKHMFFAAMNFDTCELTPIGRHYWTMIKERRI